MCLGAARKGPEGGGVACAPVLQHQTVPVLDLTHKPGAGGMDMISPRWAHEDGQRRTFQARRQRKGRPGKEGQRRPQVCLEASSRPAFRECFQEKQTLVFPGQQHRLQRNCRRNSVPPGKESPLPKGWKEVLAWGQPLTPHPLELEVGGEQGWSKHRDRKREGKVRMESAEDTPPLSLGHPALGRNSPAINSKLWALCPAASDWVTDREVLTPFNAHHFPNTLPFQRVSRPRRSRLRRHRFKYLRPPLATPARALSAGRELTLYSSQIQVDEERTRAGAGERSGTKQGQPAGPLCNSRRQPPFPHPRYLT